jgi:AraC-like DNA-binding protein
MSPHEYVAKRRVTRAQELLSEANMTITQVAETLGFETIHSFSRWFHKEMGVSPSAYQKQSGVV